VPGIHVFLARRETKRGWPGRAPAMTIFDNPPNKKAGVVAGFSHQLLIRQN
jgi:hypothetical protein